MGFANVEPAEAAQLLRELADHIEDMDTVKVDYSAHNEIEEYGVSPQGYAMNRPVFHEGEITIRWDKDLRREAIRAAFDSAKTVSE